MSSQVGQRECVKPKLFSIHFHHDNDAIRPLTDSDSIGLAPPDECHVIVQNQWLGIGIFGDLEDAKTNLANILFPNKSLRRNVGFHGVDWPLTASFVFKTRSNGKNFSIASKAFTAKTLGDAVGECPSAIFILRHVVTERCRACRPLST